MESTAGRPDEDVTFRGSGARAEKTRKIKTRNAETVKNGEKR